MLRSVGSSVRSRELNGTLSKASSCSSAPAWSRRASRGNHVGQEQVISDEAALAGQPLCAGGKHPRSWGWSISDTGGGVAPSSSSLRSAARCSAQTVGDASRSRSSRPRARGAPRCPGRPAASSASRIAAGSLAMVVGASTSSAIATSIVPLPTSRPMHQACRCCIVVQRADLQACSSARVELRPLVQPTVLHGPALPC